jgi:hypothetical protein
MRELSLTRCAGYAVQEINKERCKRLIDVGGILMLRGGG